MSRHWLLRAGIAAFTSLWVAQAASAQETRTISGTVVDSAGQRVPYVTIDAGPRYRTLANASGEFRLIEPKLRQGQVVIDLVRAFGDRTSNGDGYRGICW